MRLILLALFLVASFLGSGCSSSDDPSQPVLAGGTVARIEISPRGALLVPSANNETFSAKAFDANGQEIAAAFTWTSNAPDVIALEPAGASARATARIATGSALVTAEAGGVKTVVFAVAAEPAPGTVLLRDDQISALPKAIDPAAPFGPGFRYRVGRRGRTLDGDEVGRRTHRRLRRIVDHRRAAHARRGPAAPRHPAAPRPHDGVLG